MRARAAPSAAIGSLRLRELVRRALRAGGRATRAVRQPRERAGEAVRKHEEGDQGAPGIPSLNTRRALISRARTLVRLGDRVLQRHAPTLRHCDVGTIPGECACDTALRPLAHHHFQLVESGADFLTHACRGAEENGCRFRILSRETERNRVEAERQIDGILERRPGVVYSPGSRADNPGSYADGWLVNGKTKRGCERAQRAHNSRIARQARSAA
jgi:hypothetical protein